MREAWKGRSEDSSRKGVQEQRRRRKQRPKRKRKEPLKARPEQLRSNIKQWASREERRRVFADLEHRFAQSS